MTDPTPLSPAAQAVLDAFRSSHTGQGCLAAALRAAADQAQASVYHTTPSTDWGKGWKEGIRDAVKGLYAIAAELDGTSGLEPNDLSHLSEEGFQSLAPQGYHAP